VLGEDGGDVVEGRAEERQEMEEPSLRHYTTPMPPSYKLCRILPARSIAVLCNLNPTAGRKDSQMKRQIRSLTAGGSSHVHLEMECFQSTYLASVTISLSMEGVPWQGVKGFIVGRRKGMMRCIGICVGAKED